jgi:integrase
MASLRKVKGGWRVEVCVSGVRESAVHRTQREAQAWGAQREVALRELALREGGQAVPGAAVSLRGLLERYQAEVSPLKRGARWESVRISAILREGFGLPLDRPASGVLPEDVARFRDVRLASVSAGSVLREIGILSAAFEHGRREWRVCASNPVSDVRKPANPPHRERVIGWREVRAMCRALGYRHFGPVVSVQGAVAVCFLVALRTGMRAGELCGMRWEQVRPGFVVLPVTKTRPREVPLDPRAEALIGRMRGFDPGGLVFGVASATLDTLFRRARVKAGLSGFVFHDARHTAATRLAKRVEVLTLCKIFGWASTTQALTYYNPSAGDLRAAIMKKAP